MAKTIDGNDKHVNKEEVITFRTELTGADLSDRLPSRDQMHEALECALEAMMSRVLYLSEDAATNVTVDGGGLADNSHEVYIVLDNARRLVLMYEGLLPAEET